jgi:hypothetical protein
VWLSLFRDLFGSLPIWWLLLLVWSIFGWGGLQLFCGKNYFGKCWFGTSNCCTVVYTSSIGIVPTYLEGVIMETLSKCYGCEGIPTDKMATFAEGELCQFCYYSGRGLLKPFGWLLEALEKASGTTWSGWQMGGGCMALGTNLQPDGAYILVTDDEGVIQSLGGEEFHEGFSAFGLGFYADEDDCEGVYRDGLTLSAMVELISNHMKEGK